MRFLLSAGVAAFLVFACGDDDNSTNTPKNDGGTPGQVCGDDPLSEPCLADEKGAIFVLPSGSDVLGTGTRERPVKSLEHALTLLTPDRRRVYLGEGAALREENATNPIDPTILGAKQAGLTLIGGING